MAEVKTTLSFTKRLEERGVGGGRERGRKGFRRGEEKKHWRKRGLFEMASKGLAVTMVPPSSVTVGTDLPQC